MQPLKEEKQETKEVSSKVSLVSELEISHMSEYEPKTAKERVFKPSETVLVSDWDISQGLEFTPTEAQLIALSDADMKTVRMTEIRHAEVNLTRLSFVFTRGWISPEIGVYREGEVKTVNLPEHLDIGKISFKTYKDFDLKLYCI